jgi:hypothetical protein
MPLPGMLLKGDSSLCVLSQLHSPRRARSCCFDSSKGNYCSLQGGSSGGEARSNQLYQL